MPVLRSDDTRSRVRVPAAKSNWGLKRLAGIRAALDARPAEIVRATGPSSLLEAGALLALPRRRDGARIPVPDFDSNYRRIEG